MTKILLALILTCTCVQAQFVPFGFIGTNGAPSGGGGGGGPTTPPSLLPGSTFGAFNGGSATLTATVTVPAGSSGLMLISVGQGNNANAHKAVTSVTYNSAQVATAIPGASRDDGNFCKVEGFYIVAPSVQTSVSLTVVFASAPGIVCVQCSVYTNAAQSGSIFGTAVLGSSTGTSTATVTVTTGTGQINWGATTTDANGVNSITIGGTSSPTSRNEQENVSSDMAFGIGETTGSGTFQWTWTPPDNGWAMFAVPVNGL